MWIRPECDSALGIAVSVTVQALEAAFAEAASRQLKVGAVLLVSPSYFGSCSDIAGSHLLFLSVSIRFSKLPSCFYPSHAFSCGSWRVEMAKLCHQRGVPLIVDEAHGGHFAFSRQFPQV